MPETDPLISYAQHFEDIRLLRALTGIEIGFYVDVGASHPTVDSVTRIFYERGWRGIDVEPLPKLAALLRVARPGDLVVQAAVSDAPGPVTFYDIDGGGLSTIREDLAERWRAAGYPVTQYEVAGSTLPEVLKGCVGKEIHFLKLDAEGAEGRILSACNFQTGTRPWIILVESSDPGTSSPQYSAWEQQLLASSYVFACEDAANRYYVACEHPSILKALRRPLSLVGVVRRQEAEAVARSRLLEEECVRLRHSSQLLEEECVRLRRSRGLRRLEKRFRLWRKKAFGMAAAAAPPPSEEGEGLSLGVQITGGAGDCVIVARFLRDWAGWLSGEVRFQIRYRRAESVGFLFAGLPAATLLAEGEEPKEKTDAEFTINQFLFWDPDRISVNALGRKSPAFLRWLDQAEHRAEELKKYRDRHPFLDGAYANFAILRGIRRENALHAQCGVPYGGALFPLSLPDNLPRAFGLESGSYLTLHDGWDPNFPVESLRPTKAYPPDLWGKLVHALRESLPGIALVQIGGKSGSPIAGVDRDLRGKTTLAESVALLRGARLHIDTESGLVHLASCVGTRCAVLFGPTNLAFFGYPRNINLPPKVCGNCWWSTDSWMSFCPRGSPGSPCMESIDPKEAAEKIASALSEGCK